MSAVVFSYSALVVSNRETRASYRLLSFHFRIIHGHYPPFNVLTSLKVAKKRHNKRNNHLAEDNNYHDKWKQHQSKPCQNPTAADTITIPLRIVKLFSKQSTHGRASFIRDMVLIYKRTFFCCFYLTTRRSAYMATLIIIPRALIIAEPVIRVIIIVVLVPVVIIVRLDVVIVRIE